MPRKTFFKVVAVIWALSGLIILAGVIWPIVSYQTKPVNTETTLAESNDSDAGITTDFTKASTWFSGGKSASSFNASVISYYNLSIPKLRIDKAVVAIGGENLAEHLIQYPGTALPGKTGNAVIFGHSILPIFYNPKDYISIFSTLPTLKKGDEIFVSYDGVDYTYKVETSFEVLPTDIQVLEQDSSDSFLTLVTCVPPGDPRRPKRLIVRARVVPLD